MATEWLGLGIRQWQNAARIGALGLVVAGLSARAEFLPPEPPRPTIAPVQTSVGGDGNQLNDTPITPPITPPTASEPVIPPAPHEQTVPIAPTAPTASQASNAPPTSAPADPTAASANAASAATGDYEAPPTFQTREVIPAEWFQSENYTLGQEATAKGFFLHFNLESPYGSYAIDSVSLLQTRLQEIDVLARTIGMKGQNEFVKALGGRLKDTGKAVVGTIINPVKTAKAVVSGVENKAKDVADFFRGKSRESLTGGIVGQQKRKFAAKLGLDVYSTNPKVQEFLESMARARTAANALISVGTMAIPGGIGVSVAISVVNYRANVTEILYENSPAQLHRMNDKKLKKMGVDKEPREHFLEFPDLSYRQKTIIVADLEAMGKLTDAGAFVVWAYTGKHPEGGVWQEKAADVLACYSKDVEAIESLQSAGDGIAAKTTGGKRILVMPADILYWDARAEASITAFQAFTEVDKAAPRECVITGRATLRAKKELESRGITLRETFLDAPPFLTP